MANETEKKGFAHLIGYIKNALSLKADKTEIPSLTGYATETWVGQQIANIPDELPSGGSAGDFLRRTSSGTAWQTVPSAESASFGGGST